MRSLLLLLALPLLGVGGEGWHKSSVTFDSHIATLSVVCHCPKIPPCPCPTLSWGKVLPFVLSMEATPVETWEFKHPLQYGLNEWIWLQARLGSPVARRYELRSLHAYNAYEMADLCVTGPFDEFDTEPVRYCTFAHLAAVHVAMHRGPTWWMDLYRDGHIDMLDVQLFLNQFGRDFRDD